MPVQIGKMQFYQLREVLDELSVTRQTLWRWRSEGLVPGGRRHRGQQILFTADEVEEIRRFSDRLEPANLAQTDGGRQ